MKNKKLQILILFIMLSVSKFSNAYITYNVDSNGKLLGASNVEFLNAYYDVTFVDGSCFSIYGDCSSTQFLIDTYYDSIAASNALLSTVFVDNIYGSFFSDPSLINGCTDTSICIIYTPYGINSNGEVLVGEALKKNPSISYFDVDGTTVPTTFDTTQASNITYAIWSPTRPKYPLPEPNMIAILITGFLSLLFSIYVRRNIIIN
jgi:hypothetical protein